MAGSTGVGIVLDAPAGMNETETIHSSGKRLSVGQPGEQPVDDPDGEARVHAGLPAGSRSKRKSPALTTKMMMKSMNATADAKPRFHQRKPSSYMK